MSNEQELDVTQVPMTTHRDGANAAARAIDEYQEQIADLKAQTSEIAAGKQEVHDSLAGLYGNLALSLLPDATTETVEAAAAAVACPSLREDLASQRAERHAQIKNLEAQAEQAKRNCRAKLQQNGERLSQIEADKRFTDSEAQVTALNIELETVQGQLTAWTITRSGFEHDGELMNLYGRRNDPPTHWFLKLLGVLCLFIGPIVGWLRKRRAQAVAERYQMELEACYRSYDQAVAECQRLADYFRDINEKIREICELKSEHARLGKDQVSQQAKLNELSAGDDEYSQAAAELKAELEDAQGVILSAIQDYLVSHLRSFDAYDQAHANFEGEAKMLVASIVAQKAKLPYFRNMIDHLNAQIDDRQTQVGKLAKVRRTWSRRPYNRLARYGGAEEKAAKLRNWMVALPHSKRRSTTKTITLVRPMYVNTFGFSDYLMYSMLLDSCGYGGFLSLDVFGRCGDEAMPYDGFCQNVCPEVGDYREEHGKADYSEIDAANTEAHGDAEGAAAAYAASEAADEAGAGLDAEFGGTDNGAGLDAEFGSDDGAGQDSSFTDES